MSTPFEPYAFAPGHPNLGVFGHTVCDAFAYSDSMK